MPQYMLLIYADPTQAPPPEEMQAELPKWFAYGEQMTSAGVMVGGDALHPTSAATTLRVREGDRLVTDGPFAETKEQLGGYYLIDAKNVDEAIAIAGRIPSARHGSIEVRPVAEMPKKS